MQTTQIAAQARYIVSDPKVSVDEVWDVLKSPFRARYKSWHPSYDDFKPVKNGVDGHPEEFEVYGTSGGRYTFKIENLSEQEKLLRIWRGPSLNPPEGSRGKFVGLVYQFMVTAGIKSVFIEIGYQETWLKQNGWLRRGPSFEDGPKREIHWIFGKFPIAGYVDYIRPCDPSDVAEPKKLGAGPAADGRLQTIAGSFDTRLAESKKIVRYDVFISHASEDKQSLVRPLAESLRAAGVRVWYDEFELAWGASLRASIDRGLAASRYGLVILSPRFFAKQWPQRELNGLVATVTAGQRRILPIWHDIGANEMATYSPMLADLLAVNSSEGMKAIVAKVIEACGE